MSVRLFMKRTANIFRHQVTRAKRYDRLLPYTLADLRALTWTSLSCHAPCPYCHIPLSDALFSCDHTTPLSRGGDFNLPNLVICCTACNQRKGSLTGEEYTALLAVIQSWPAVAEKDVLRRLRAGGRFSRAS